MRPTDDLNVDHISPLPAPKAIKSELPMSEAANQTVVASREQVKRILTGEDPRIMVAVGPCSIHDQVAAIEYARRLSRLAERVGDRMLLLMRVYFEKPRTTVGWKGLINDPHLDDTFDIENGLRLARSILLQVAELGLATATEMLEPVTPQYIADLITVASIGARTSESPTHRQMASGLSMPVGFKNGTDGSLQVAIDAMQSARTPHRFVGIDHDGNTCVVHTKGNSFGYLILRGGRSGPNYFVNDITAAVDKLAQAGFVPRLMVDCSHANSNKDFRRQAVVWRELIAQRVSGLDAVVGIMLESNLREGSQKIPADLSQLQFGVSVTDPCIGWEETEALILETHERLSTANASLADAKGRN